ELPVGPLLVDFSGCHSLVLAVVPLNEVRIYVSRRAQAGQFAGPPCPLEGAREYPGESQALEPFPQAAGIALAALGERDVGQAGVLAVDSPRRLAVAGQVDDRQALTHDELLV